jgi:hypothetical protein
MKHIALVTALAAAVAACNAPTAGNNAAAAADTPTAIAPEPGAPAGPAPAKGNAAIEPPLTPPPPGQPGALPDDRTPVSEAPFTADSAQGAATIVQTYYALIEAGKYAEARRLWSDGGAASGADEAGFGKRFTGYRVFRALIGAPGTIEGAAGSLYVDVPVQLYGRRADGREYSVTGRVRLRRSNDVPGATAEQRTWHIVAATAAPPA